MDLSWVNESPATVLDMLAKEAAMVRTFGPVKEAFGEGWLSNIGNQIQKLPGGLSHLKEYGQQIAADPHTQWTLAGAGVGGAAGLASSFAQDKEDRHPVSSALTGALAGGAAGLGGSLLKDVGQYATTDAKPPVSREPINVDGHVIPPGASVEDLKGLESHPSYAWRTGLPAGVAGTDIVNTGLKDRAAAQAAKQTAREFNIPVRMKHPGDEEYAKALRTRANILKSRSDIKRFTQEEEPAMSWVGRTAKRFNEPVIGSASKWNPLRRWTTYPAALGAGYAADKWVEHMHENSAIDALIQRLNHEQ
jgi:hypothetical protein